MNERPPRESGAVGPPARNARVILRLTALAALVLLPKCLACVAGYFVVLTGLAVATPELCGLAEGRLFDGGTYVTAGLGLAAAVGGTYWRAVKKRRDLSAGGAAKR